MASFDNQSTVSHDRLSYNETSHVGPDIDVLIFAKSGKWFELLDHVKAVWILYGQDIDLGLVDVPCRESSVSARLDHLPGRLPTAR